MGNLALKDAFPDLFFISMKKIAAVDYYWNREQSIGTSNLEGAFWTESLIVGLALSLRLTQSIWVMGWIKLLGLLKNRDLEGAIWL